MFYPILCTYDVVGLLKAYCVPVTLLVCSRILRGTYADAGVSWFLVVVSLAPPARLWSIARRMTAQRMLRRWRCMVADHLAEADEVPCDTRMWLRAAVLFTVELGAFCVA